MEAGSVSWFIICSILAILNIGMAGYSLKKQKKSTSIIDYIQLGIGVGIIVRILWEVWI